MDVTETGINSEDSLARLRKCLDQVRRVAQPVQYDSLIMQGLGFESIDVVDLLFVLEQEFNAVMTMLEFNQFVLKLPKRPEAEGWDFTVRDLENFVRSRA